MYGLYHTFNFLTGYTQVNPSVQSIEWRLIVLESVAGVPGFVAAGTSISNSYSKSFPYKHLMTISSFLNPIIRFKTF